MGEAEAQLAKALDEKIALYTQLLEIHEFRKACAELRGLWVLGNEYLQEAAPWTAFKSDPDQAAVSVRVGLNLIRLYGHLSAPLIPFTAEKILKIFGETMEDLDWPTKGETIINHLAIGTKFTPPEILFSKIDDDKIKEWRIKFGGLTE